MFRIVTLALAAPLLLCVSPAAAGWVKTCTATSCETASDIGLGEGNVSIKVQASNEDDSDAAVIIAVPAPEDALQTLRYTISGKIDFAFSGDEIGCAAGVCYVNGLIGKQGVADLKRASLLELTASYASGTQRSFPISLKGFTRAHEGQSTASTDAVSETEIEARARELKRQLSEESNEGAESASPGLWTKRCDTVLSCVTQGPVGNEEGDVANIWIESEPKYDVHTIFIQVPAGKDDPLRYQVPGAMIFTFPRPTSCDGAVCLFEGDLDPSDIADLEGADRLDLWTAFGKPTERGFKVPLAGFAEAFESRPTPLIAEDTTLDSGDADPKWVKQCRDAIICTTEISHGQPGARIWVRSDFRLGLHDIHFEVPAVEGNIYSLRYVVPDVDDQSIYAGFSCHQDTCEYSDSVSAADLEKLKNATVLELTASYATGPARRFDFELTGFADAFDGAGKPSAEPDVSTSSAENVDPAGAAAPAPAWVKFCGSADFCWVESTVTVAGGIVRVEAYPAPNSEPWVKVVLPPGLTVNDKFTWVIPGRADYSYAIGSCQPRGCVTLGQLGNAGVEEMKRGNVLNIGYVAGGKRHVAEFTLKGFTAAYDGEGSELDPATDAAPEPDSTLPEETPASAATDLANGKPERPAVELVEGKPVLADWIRACIPNGPESPPLCGTTAYIFSGSAVVATASVLEPEAAIPASLSFNLIGEGILAGEGVVVQIDDHTPVRFPIQSCDMPGFCTTRAKIPENWTAWLEAGATLTVSFNSATQVKGAIPLADFAQAFNGPMSSEDEVLEWRRSRVERAE